ncbi:hypothetical protein CEXT_96601 [Caerostris extrusa]|uniref:Uncharacterized protein n=1 Tax=Caerostris extrusa TaxID=172846 RepID=A0AAV4XKI0_CAEEX|nr:hypothetical protein CEXT_96601 [Caerostris extrusa]
MNILCIAEHSLIPSREREQRRKHPHFPDLFRFPGALHYGVFLNGCPNEKNIRGFLDLRAQVKNYGSKQRMFGNQYLRKEFKEIFSFGFYRFVR